MNVNYVPNSEMNAQCENACEWEISQHNALVTYIRSIYYMAKIQLLPAGMVCCTDCAKTIYIIEQGQFIRKRIIQR